MAAEKANFGLKTKIIGLLSFVLLMPVSYTHLTLPTIA